MIYNVIYPPRAYKVDDDYFEDIDLNNTDCTLKSFSHLVIFISIIRLICNIFGGWVWFTLYSIIYLLEICGWVFLLYSIIINIRFIFYTSGGWVWIYFLKFNYEMQKNFFFYLYQDLLLRFWATTASIDQDIAAVSSQNRSNTLYFF